MTTHQAQRRARADVHNFIEVVGARQNNLREIDIRLPKNKVIAIVGRSGSGKSSLAFETIAAEAQRRLNATYPAFIQSLMGALPRPDVDTISGLGAAVVIDQSPIGSSARSTVGTFTELWSLLRALYHACGTPPVRSIASLSFNDPEGMCTNCNGSGVRMSVNLEAIVDKTKSLNEGAILFPNFAVGSLFWSVYANADIVDLDAPISDYDAEQYRLFMYGTKDEVAKVNTGSYNLAYEGLMVKLERLYFSKDVHTLKGHVRAAVEASVTSGVCSECDGSRLSQAARVCTVADVPFGALHSMTIVDLLVWTKALPSSVPTTLISELRSTLRMIADLGVGYLALGRPTATLSRGEGQRLKVARVASSPLTDAIYIFDEPTAGLHPDEHQAVFDICAALRDAGNTVILVEHSSVVAARSDWLVEIGPESGSAGGTVVYEGPPRQTSKADADLGEPVPRSATREDIIRVPEARANNLQGFSVSVPRQALTVITGPSGAGKTSLLDLSWPESVERTLVDQSPIAVNRRSNIATWTGVLDAIRKLFASENNVNPSLFSANSEGACPGCEGLGMVYTDLAHLGTVSSICTHCDGRRYRAEVLEHLYRGKSIADVLDLRMPDALEVFADQPRIKQTLLSLSSLGLDYLALGQPLTTLSGGERQRLRLTESFGSSAAVICVDEPSLGLHPQDVKQLMLAIESLIVGGATVVVADHHPIVLAHAHYVIELGPGAGPDGGTLLSEGWRSRG